MKILLLGKNGQVGHALQRALVPLGELHALDRAQCDLADEAALRAAIRRIAPQVIVNAAAYTAVDRAESEAELAQRINADAVAAIAQEAAAQRAWLVHYSTDYVFDGDKNSPYDESDDTAPLSVYGRSKLAGEQAIAAAHGRHLVFRTSWVYAAHGSNFAKTMLRLAAQRATLSVVADQFGAPTSAELIADVTALALYRVLACEGGEALAGLYHLSAAGQTNWCDYARFVIGRAASHGLPLQASPETVRPIATADYPTAARRPRNSRLDSGRLRAAFGLHLPDWRHHLASMIDDLATRDNSA
ncbi:MAG: dTDP-4-dehydrorhamnose reductase [Burkholderiales bacterium]|nr:dTDP-4-dehydrorhamnose reductase [Burkholderiales bacterium]ODU68454.1 MAG: dTDP-4-dehydrorhamnose reductase [Lautropia sp. SCN 66-9]